MQQKILITLLFIFVLSGTISLLKPQWITFLGQKTQDLIPEPVPELSINGNDLKTGIQQIIYTDNLSLEINLHKASEIQSLSIDDSLNVLKDSFYGKTEIQNDNVLFTPDFTFTPGSHHILIKTSKGQEEQFNFVVAYHEDFSEPLQKNHNWLIPSTSSSKWFSVKDGKLSVSPDKNLPYSSLAFLFKLNENLVIDFEFSALGENVDAVPYLINSVRNEFALGSNNNERNVLFHSDSNERKQVEGASFKWEKNARYQIRIKRQDGVIHLDVLILKDGEKVNPSATDSSFKELFTFDDKDGQGKESHYFGISAWQNSDGFTVDDVYITNL